ncbi:MAG: dihydrodipicolinate synthase family protein [Armatimonas sp.]
MSALAGKDSKNKNMPMTPDTLRAKLQGVVAFPVTPFHDDLSLNLDGLRANVRALLKHPLCAIVPGAGTGEFHTLTSDELKAVVEATVEEVGGKVPVLAAAGVNVHTGALLAKQAAQAGADGILAFPPYYATSDTEGLLGYYSAISNATELGTIIYSRDWLDPSPALLESLAELLPNLIALKDGQGDVRKLSRAMATVGDRLHYLGGAGDDCVAGYYALGIRCYTSSIANVAPRLSLKLHELASAGDFVALGKLLAEQVVPLYALRTQRKGYEVSAMKHLMTHVGLVGGPVRPPLADIPEALLPQLERIAEDWKPWL